MKPAPARAVVRMERGCYLEAYRLLRDVRPECLPVMRQQRVGAQSAAGVCASVNRIPSEANRSIAGVGTFGAQ